MGLQVFTLLLDGLPSMEQINEVKVASGTLVIEHDPTRRTVELTFIREERALIDAIVLAVREVEAAGLVASRVGGQDDDLMTLGAIAERVGRTREAVRLWQTGRTGPGGFPAPVDTGASTRYYRWSQVVPWLRERMGMPLPDPDPIVSAANLALQLRALAPRVSRMDAVRSLLAA
jgi:hypothetical protein